ncbi:MAG TPA: L-seryl-tRNA(Sec) selenium transferase, partial [Burkholderiaceae bacterium]|nr:L-seryl-tRNA(Sec) selenium transferase [Burkholderiaceae bacterium]
MADQLLARIPQLQRLLQTPRAQALAQRFEREATVRELRAQLQKVRAELRAGTGEAVPDFFSQEFFAEVELALRQRRRAGPARVINGTGVILHTNLGRAPLATQAREAIDAASGYAALELDLVSGDRGVRHAAVRDRLCRLTGAQDAIVVNNGAAAVMLMLAALARDGQVIVSRGELIEIGGGFRIPDVIAQSGAR